MAIVGTNQSDDIDTGGNNDRIFARGGNDVVFSGGGKDVVFAETGHDSVSGAGGNDVLFGGTGNDLVAGGGGKDRLAVEVGFANFGTDVLQGSSGFDTIVFKTAFISDVNDLNPQANVAPAARGVLVNLANVFGPRGTVRDFDVSQIDANGELINTLPAPRGQILDSASLGSGAFGPNGVLDVIDNPSSVFADIEEIDLTDFADYFLDSTASHVINGGKGNDFISGGGGNDNIDGGTGDDTALYRLSSFRVSVTLIDFGNGGSGSGGEAQGDKLFSIENVFGSEFNDTLIGDGKANLFRGFGGLDSLLGGDGGDRLFGGNANDKLIGGSGGDSLDGGLDSDTLDGGAGNDGLNGGAGNDTALFQSWNSVQPFGIVRGAIVLSEGKTAGSAVLSRTLIGSGETVVIERDGLSAVENIVASNFKETITGNSAGNVLEGRGGGDAINGKLGSDTASYRGSSQGVTVDLLNGTATGGDAASDTFLSIENLLGSDHADTLIGDSGANVLSGVGGRDILLGGVGADIIDGGASIDKADYGGSSLGVTVDLNVSPGLAQTSVGDASGDRLLNIEDVSGSNLGDVLKGNSGANRLSGRGGDDRLEGGGNSDNYIGGAGLGTDRIFDAAGTADVLTVTSLAQIVSSTRVGDDLTIVYTGGGTLVIEKHFLEANRIETVHDLATNTSLVLATGNIGANGSGIISGTDSADFLDGNGGNDRLFGNAGADVLEGGRGRDRLSGGDDNDILTGGRGKNVFVFNTAPDPLGNVDSIADFKPGKDRIELDNAIFTALAKTGVLKAKFFNVGKEAGDQNDHIIYTGQTGELFYDADGTGVAGQVLFARLDKHLDLDIRDFFVV